MILYPLYLVKEAQTLSRTGVSIFESLSKIKLTVRSLANTITISELLGLEVDYLNQ